MDTTIKHLENWKRNILVFSLIPIIIIALVNVYFHNLIDIAYQGDFSSLFSLKGQKLLFSSDIALSQYVNYISVSCINTFYLLITLWFILYSITNYLKLSSLSCFTIGAILELFVIVFLYFKFFLPTNVLLVIMHIILLLFNLIMVVVYWYYQVKVENEKR